MLIQLIQLTKLILFRQAQLYKCQVLLKIKKLTAIL